MVKTKSSKKKTGKCGWCDGTGDFYDFDSDFGYGIPVCGGCGGLGHVPIEEDPEFKAKVKEIQLLRHEYCPVDARSFFKMHPVYLLSILEELIEKVTAHFKTYGNTTDESLASSISKDSLNKVAKEYSTIIAEKILLLEDKVNNQHSFFMKQLTEIELAIWQGMEFSEIEKMFQNLMENYSNLSTFHFVHGKFLISFSHFAEAIPILEKAMEHKTDTATRASILYALSRCLYIIDRDKEAMQKAHQGLEACDPDSNLYEELVRFIKRI